MLQTLEVSNETIQLVHAQSTPERRHSVFALDDDRAYLLLGKVLRGQKVTQTRANSCPTPGRVTQSTVDFKDLLARHLILRLPRT